MKEKPINLGGVQFTTQAQEEDYYIILTFGPEGSGKTRLPLTGPETIGYLPLERKSYATLKKDAAALGKRILLPSNPEELITNPRKARLMLVTPNTQKAKEDANLAVRAYYREFADRIKDALYAMLELPEVKIVVVDTFTKLCNILESSLYGFEDRFMKVDGKVYKDKREYRQEVVDLMNSLSVYRKHVILTHTQKDEYNKVGPTGRKIWEGFPALAHYCKLVVHQETNPKWVDGSADKSKAWHYAVTVRTCQENPSLEGGDMQRFLKDEDITLVNLLLSVNPELDVSGWE